MEQKGVQISTTDEGAIAVRGEYNADFVVGARRLGGRWDADLRSWIFDVRTEVEARALCLEIYGSDGGVAETVDVRITALRGVDALRDGVRALGRVVARARGPRQRCEAR